MTPSFTRPAPRDGDGAKLCAFVRKWGLGMRIASPDLQAWAAIRAYAEGREPFGVEVLSQRHEVRRSA